MFPHYTWGCIASFKFLKPASNVPSLYVRVYRHFSSPPATCNRSLTIREGVSLPECQDFIKVLFPHYTWGCIVLSAFQYISVLVPSLYVRVYRCRRAPVTLHASSLTIREGVSDIGRMWEICWTFPHYTWGCIAGYTRALQRWQVPSLYVRVYRLDCRNRTMFRCSLTIREGVSHRLLLSGTPASFPHYTWGCIAYRIRMVVTQRVPSLYVRVYQGLNYRLLPGYSSLTIREGVSYPHGFPAGGLLFPHYTWGCIAEFEAIKGNMSVPSLYVRVYHSILLSGNLCWCSLTIREGVSRLLNLFFRRLLFPHYTWGCIVVKESQRTTGGVPSLYVRVYHMPDTWTRLYASSLTIREGVSQQSVQIPTELLFPHYTWGCIVSGKNNLSNNDVPSLYVRVYRRWTE